MAGSPHLSVFFRFPVQEYGVTSANVPSWFILLGVQPECGVFMGYHPVFFLVLDMVRSSPSVGHGHGSLWASSLEMSELRAAPPHCRMLIKCSLI